MEFSIRGRAAFRRKYASIPGELTSGLGWEHSRVGGYPRLWISVSALSLKKANSEEEWAMDVFDKIVCRVGVGLMLAGLFLAVAATESGSRVAAGQGSATQKSSNTNASDQQFLRKAADDNLAEVEMGRLALQKASSQDVKNFAQTMVRDHGKTKEELEKIARTKRVDIPKTPGAKNKAAQDRLAKFSGEQFDSAYMAEMLKDHKDDVTTFRRELNSAQDMDIKQFADKSMPTLESHLKQAENIAPELKAERSALRKPSAAILRSRQVVR
jgi:putative membrane protein